MNKKLNLLMNKKLMVLAVASALAVPVAAFAQVSNVQIYGRAGLGVDNYEAKGATNPAGDIKARMRVVDVSSRIGFRGREDLGGGLRAIFVIESGVAIDSGNNNGQSGGNNTSVGFGSSRVGYVGIEGNWGQLSFGRRTAWYTNGRHEQWRTNYGTVNTAFFTGGLARGMSPSVTRVSNAVQYQSPVFSGINAIVTWSPTAQEGAAANNANTDGRVWAVTLNGDHGSFLWGWDWTNNALNTPKPSATTTVTAATCAAGVVKIGCAQGSVTANKVKGSYFYAPGGHVALFYISSAAKNGGSSGVASATAIVDATASELKQHGTGVVWEHGWGNWIVEGTYAKMQDISGCTVAASCSDTNYTAWMVGVRYALSKRTGISAAYVNYANARNYNADVNPGGMSSAQGTLATGADPRIYALGLTHNF